MSYKFPEALYDNNISYVNAYSIYQFFDTKERTAEVFKYIVTRIIEESKPKGDGFNMRFAALLDSTDLAVIDVEYNFFVKVLGEWIEHYSANKFVQTEYRRIVKFDEKDEEGNAYLLPKYRDFNFKFSTTERVIFDYGVNGWTIKNKFHKNCRNHFLSTFLTNIVHANVIYMNLKVKVNYRTANYIYLLQDEAQNGEYVEFNSIKLVQKNLKEIVGEAMLKNLKQNAKKYEQITSQNRHVRNKIEKMKEENIEVEVYRNIELIELESSSNNKRDFGDKKWHVFEKKKEDVDEKKLDDELKNVPHFDED